MQISLPDLVLDQDAIDRLASGTMDFGPRTPFSDWRNAANELAAEADIEAREAELRSQIDPGRGSAIGRGTFRDVAREELVDQPNAAAWMDTYTSQGLPPYKVNEEGQKVYINTPKGVNLVDLLQGADKEEYLAMKKAGFDERLTKTPYNVQSGLYGSGAGNYGTTVVPEKLNNFQKALSSPVVSALAAFIPGGSLALVATKGLAGVDVSPVEIALAAYGAYGDYAKSIANKAIKETGGQAVGPSIDVELTTAEQQAAAIDVIDIAGDPSAFAGVDIAAVTPETVASALTDTQYLSNTIEKIIDDVGTDAAFENLTPAQYGQQLLKHGGERAYRQVFSYGGAPRTLLGIPDEIVSLAGGVGNIPDFIMETTMEDYTRPPSSRTETTVDVSKLEDTPVTETQPTRESFLPSEQPDGGGGGAAGGAGLAGGATTTTAGSVSVTPTIDYTAPGAVTSSLFSDVMAPAATAASTVTQTSPITATATTAPVTEETQTTTTEPTSILEDTTADTTTAPVTTGGGSTGGVEDPISTGGAEGTGAEGGASGGADDGSGTDGVVASGQEGGEDTAGDGTTAGGGAGDAGDAEGAGEGTGEDEGAGEGTGDGDGSGDGTGRGSGAGGGLGIGGAGGIGTSMFSDYLYGFQRPQILESTQIFTPYQAPAIQSLFRGIR